jgi:serine protease AprX
MDEVSLLKEKLDPTLLEIVGKGEKRVVPVIVQTEDGLKNEDRQVMATLGGKVKDDLYIINAFSAEINASALSSLILSPRIRRIFYDAEVRAV